jgi:outer membrane murein-binding lipoprotein Lpp
MNKLALATAGFALLSLAACGRGEQDRLDETQLNQGQVEDRLDKLASDAANLANEAEDLERQAVQLNRQAQAIEEPAGDETDYDEDIEGM